MGVRTSHHTGETPRKGKAARVEQFECHGIRLEAVHNDRVAGGLRQKCVQELFRNRAACGHPRSEMIREQTTAAETVALCRLLFPNGHCKFRCLILQGVEQEAAIRPKQFLIQFANLVKLDPSQSGGCSS